MPTQSSNSLEYINATEYSKLDFKLKQLKSILEDNNARSKSSRELRYTEIDIEAQRLAQRIQPDELYIPQHIIDTNIRTEQSSYVQYITESPRAVIVENLQDQTTDMAVLEKDLTKKLRYEDWQIPAYANIDAFQANGYSIMEVCFDKNAPGHLIHETVQHGDFAFISDTRDLQAVEMTARTYYYTRTKLMELSDPEMTPKDKLWDRAQVKKIIGEEATGSDPDNDNLVDGQDKSLYRVQKIMFRVKGVVHAAWSCYGKCDDWLRKPKPLFVGRKRELQPNAITSILVNLFAASAGPQFEDVYETQYPYFLYPYLISENDTIVQLKGRVFLDQDTQEAVSSLISSTVTQARRAAGLYFSKDEADPNDDILQNKNVFFKSGCLINSKVKSFELKAPDPGIFSAIQTLVAGKQAETSQTSFATQNRKDSRKTAEELKLSQKTERRLSTVQVVLYSIALRRMYSYMCEIIKSRVIAGLIEVEKSLMPYYQMKWSVKPSGDIDVLEKQQLIEMMLQAWPVISTTAAAPFFLSDLIEKMFPSSAPKYIKALTDAQAQANSQQAQQQQQLMAMLIQMSAGIIQLSKQPEMFSDTGRIHAYPIVESAANQLEQLKKMIEKGTPP